MNSFTRIARFLFAIAIAVFGIQHLIYDHFILEPWPAWVPLQPFLAYVTGLLHIAIAFSIMIRKKDRQAALLLGLFYLLNALLLQVPRVIANLHSGNEWTGCFEVLAICSGSLFLAGLLRGKRQPATLPTGSPSGFPTGSSSPAWDRFTDNLVGASPYFFAACLLVYAGLHFVYADYIATLIPSWIPARLFWSYFVGVAFLASAISIAIDRVSRLAALLMGLMFYIWFAIVHMPRVIVSPQIEAEWTSAFVALAIGSAAWLLTGLRRK